MATIIVKYKVKILISDSPICLFPVIFFLYHY
jgi:hypothetical protein